MTRSANAHVIAMPWTCRGAAATAPRRGTSKPAALNGQNIQRRAFRFHIIHASPANSSGHAPRPRAAGPRSFSTDPPSSSTYPIRPSRLLFQPFHSSLQVSMPAGYVSTDWFLPVRRRDFLNRNPHVVLQYVFPSLFIYQDSSTLEAVGLTSRSTSKALVTGSAFSKYY